MKKFNLTLAITLIVSWTLLLIGWYLPDKEWLFGFDRVNVSAVAFIFVNFYTLPTMVWEHRGIEEARKYKHEPLSDNLYHMREMIKYKAIAGVLVSLLTVI